MNPTGGITVVGAKGMILLLALTLASCAPAPVPAMRTSPELPQTTKPQVLAAYGKLPLSFEANQGQTDRQVKFLSRGSGYTLFLTPTDAVLALKQGKPGAKVEAEKEAVTIPNSEPRTSNTVLRMRLVGANPKPKMVGLDELLGTVNYFIGKDRAKWRTNIPTYAKVNYREVYPGVDLVYYG